jgi:predicted enzyme related to lactoylglutathione lyase
MTNPHLRPHAYVLAVRDLANSTAYFVDVLGFSREWADADNWQSLIRDGVRLMLGRCPDALPAAELGDHSYFGFFATDDVDALHKEIAARGARILSGPADKPWGWREMAVGSPEGHRMMFAQRTAAL